ncbi:uncharacterized protein DSM5745_09263 [Aspergillus mulundensis]|uniref:Uncharacterized protein n=1 Tax=Aspergillus mulundensis TaxID=1810919 RepID=A0A3D8R039_9EURO|nr:hypothetical protein DSM5745_09263 [Aspergillus mulundensis]RDW67397.1 hypothetical protein DSM5745_09263 [Aspergillus mulundensis]
MPSIRSCSACLDRGTLCDGNPQGCQPCLRGGFSCRRDYRACPAIPQPDWGETQATAEQVAGIPSAEITTAHAPLIAALTAFYNALIQLQYLREHELVRPPHVSEHIDLDALVESGFEAQAIALILALPQVNIPRIADAEIDITPDAALPFPYLNLGSLRTATYANTARDPFYHGQGQDQDDNEEHEHERENWRIPPWALFITRPDPQRGYGFTHCRIYDMRSRTLGLWSDAMVGRAGDTRRHGRLLIDARPADEVIGEWTASLRALAWVPSLSDRERTIQAAPDLERVNRAIAHAQTMPEDWGAPMIRDERRRYHAYWAQRGIYEGCGWPDALREEELVGRRGEWNAAIRRLGAAEVDAFYRGLAGGHAI